MKIKTYKDYTSELYKEFDKVDKKSIDALIRHGLNRMATFRYIGCDVHITNSVNKMYYYLGDNYPKTEREWYKKMVRKLRMKHRMMHFLRKKPHDGYRYFGLTPDDYRLYQEGKPIPVVFFYRVQKESEIAWARQYQFKIKFEERKAWFVKEEDYVISNAEYIKELDIVYETASGKYIQRRYDNGSNSIGNTE